jgi:tetratricopeptide (TPR) repeat protein
MIRARRILEGANRLSVLVLLWPLLAAAAPTPVPSQLPLPDILGLVPIAAVPLDKPALTVPETAAPPPPTIAPALPPVSIANWTASLAVKETVTPPPPGTGVCFVRLTARQHLECGRARYQRGEFEDAAKELDQAARSAGQNPDVLHEARYWQAEALYRLQRFVDAQRLFLQVYRDVPREDIGLYSVYSTGHTYLQQRD